MKQNNITSTVVMKAPLLEGDRNPRHANTTEQQGQLKSQDNQTIRFDHTKKGSKLHTECDESHAEQL